MVKACTLDIRPRRLAFGLFAGLSSGEWAWSRTMGRFPWQSDSGRTTGQWQKTIIYQYSRVGKLRASQELKKTRGLEDLIGKLSDEVVELRKDLEQQKPTAPKRQQLPNVNEQKHTLILQATDLLNVQRRLITLPQHRSKPPMAP